MNEAHLFNDAVIMFDIWPPTPFSIQADGHHDTATQNEILQTGVNETNVSLQSEQMCSATGMYQASCAASASQESAQLSPPSSKGLLLVQKVWKEILASAAAELD